MASSSAASSLRRRASGYRRLAELPRFDLDSIKTHTISRCLPGPRGGHVLLTTEALAPITHIAVVWLREGDAEGQAAQWAQLRDGLHTYVLAYSRAHEAYLMVFVRANPGEVGTKHFDLVNYLQRYQPGSEALVSGEMHVEGDVLHVNEESGVFYNNGFHGLRAYVLRRVAPHMGDLINSVLLDMIEVRSSLLELYDKNPDENAIARRIVQQEERWMNPEVRAAVTQKYAAIFRNTMASFVAHAFGPAVREVHFTKDLLRSDHPQLQMSADFTARMCAAGINAPVYAYAPDCSAVAEDNLDVDAGYPPTTTVCGGRDVTKDEIARRLQELEDVKRAELRALLDRARQDSAFVDAIPISKLNGVLSLLNQKNLALADDFTVTLARNRIRRALAGEA